MPLELNKRNWNGEWNKWAVQGFESCQNLGLRPRGENSTLFRHDSQPWIQAYTAIPVRARLFYL